MDAHSWVYQSRCPTPRSCLLADFIVDASVDGGFDLLGHWAILLIASNGSGEYKTHRFSTLQDALTAGILKVARKAMIIGKKMKPYVELLDVPIQQRSLECGHLIIDFLPLLVRAVWSSSSPGESIAKAVSAYCVARNGAAPQSAPQVTSLEVATTT